MLKTFKKYKAAVFFVLRFFVAYTVLTLLYNAFLNTFNEAPDSVTRLVAEQSRVFVDWFDYKVNTEIVEKEPFVRFFINDHYVARIVEGCNAISVFILFTAFIIAYRGSIKKTLTFILLGGILIYFVNIFRVGVLTIGLYRFPEYKDFMHQILFPVAIYGMVFLLWVLWVNKYAKKE
ncbi:exosortase family protein XrtF [Leptobacterium flavescens]|uniref:Exosortase family protein XrtF n=1 Tax=Leptobacterium flavescens TaxID=472055 RepID=A0A6P0UND9_9FLAO|nr:exosortase family protein XrtF [Leptobacterium flavescens]NER14804.1 exosortase family protein XrtF [Leptobacterium flavescens]